MSKFQITNPKSQINHNDQVNPLSPIFFGEKLVLSEAKEVRVRGRRWKRFPPHLNLLRFAQDKFLPPSGGEEIIRSGRRKNILPCTMHLAPCTVLFIIWCLGFGISNNALASIEIDPLRIELELNQGQSNSGYITITNHGQEPVEISLSPGEYRYVFSEDTVHPAPPQPQTIDSCKTWLSLKPDRLRLEKGAKQTIKYTINTPQAASGEYVASILVDEEQKETPLMPDKTGQVKIKITPRINIPVYAAIKNSVRRAAAISEFSIIPLDEKNSMRFWVIVKNTGTVHIRPVTTITIFDKNKNLTDKIMLGQSLPIFAGFAETLSVNRRIKYPGVYTAVATVDIKTDRIAQKSIEFEVK